MVIYDIYMKKIVLAAVLFLLPLSALASIDQNLHYGDSGQNIVELQEFLTVQGFFTGQATGNFYSKTLKAVKDFQVAEGIVPVSGFVGPITRGVISKILTIIAPSNEGNATTTKAIVNVVPTISPTPQVTITHIVIPAQATTTENSPIVGAIAPLGHFDIQAWSQNATTGTTSPVLSARSGTGDIIRFEVSVYDQNNKFQKLPVTVTTDDPDLPSAWTYNGSGQINWTQVCQYYNVFNGSCPVGPVAMGNFTIIFTQPDLNLVKTYKFTVQ